MKKQELEFETMNPQREVLIAWLEEASKKGTMTDKARRRLCFEAALLLTQESDVEACRRWTCPLRKTRNHPPKENDDAG